MARNSRIDTDANAPPVTRILGRFVATHPSRGWPDTVEREAHRTFLNWVGCAIGAAASLLLAPLPGRRLIESIQAQIDSASREAREAGQRAEADVLTRYRSIRSATAPGPTGLTIAASAQP